MKYSEKSVLMADTKRKLDDVVKESKIKKKDST